MDESFNFAAEKAKKQGKQPSAAIALPIIELYGSAKTSSTMIRRLKEYYRQFDW